jgi:hypothetical protein
LREVRCCCCDSWEGTKREEKPPRKSKEMRREEMREEGRFPSSPRTVAQSRFNRNPNEMSEIVKK